ncbi:MAG: efflux RND transporter permease subunit [Mangrovibacterium sp.]
MRFVIDRKTLISMLFIGLTMLGYVSYKQAKVELLPNADLPFLNVTVSTSQESEPNYFEKEAVISVEGAISTLSGIESLESTITSRQASIAVYYQNDVDLSLAYLKLQEKMSELNSTLGEEFTLTVNRVDLSQMNTQLMSIQARGSGTVDRVRNVIDEEVTSELENIDGVAGVEVYGGKEKTLEITPNIDACEAYGITMASLRSILSQNNTNRTYVGNLVEHGRLQFVHITAEYSQIKDIENLVVADGPVLLRDIATIRFGEKEVESYSRVNGMETVSIQIIGDSQANQIELSHAALAVIAKINEKIQAKDVQLVVQENNAETMEDNINQIINLALIGGLMAIFVLWIFLKNLRIVAFVALAIPVSIFTAFNFFYAYGITINSLTLVGMALAVGMLLDNSVVVLENIYRLAANKYSADDAVIQGTKEVWRSIVAATLTTITVFLPFAFSSNYQIEMLGVNIGVSIISTLLVSLVVALLFIPMVIHFILGRKWGRNINFQKIDTNNRLVQIYVLLLKMSMRNPAVTIAGAVILFFLSFLGANLIDSGSLSEVDNDQVEIYLTMPSGSSLDKTDNAVRLIEEKLAEVAEKQDLISKVQEEEATIVVKLKEDYEDINHRTFAEIKNEISQLARKVNQGSVSTSSSSSSGGGAGSGAINFQRLLGIGSSQESIVIKGEDYKMMENVADDLEYILGELDIVDWVRSSSSGNQPEVHMKFDQMLMTTYGLTLSGVSNELNSFSNQISTGITFEQGTDEYEIVINQQQEEEEEEARSMDDLKKVQVPDSKGGYHDLQEFTNVYYSSGLSRLSRVNQEKQITLTYAFAEEADESKSIYESYAAEIDEILASYNYPSGVTASVEIEEDEMTEMYYFIGVALILIFMILASVFESLVTSVVMLFSIPLAAIGSLIAMIITGNGLSNANAMIGFLILMGVVVNNGIILIDYANILRSRGYHRSRALILAGISRVRPILITAATTIVAMFPLAMGQDEYVGAIGAPFAIVVIGGLSFSTLLTLIFIPTFYSGLENSLNWFKSLHWKWKFLQIALMAVGFLLTYLFAESFLMKLACVLLVVTLIPSSVWFALNSLTTANAQLIPEDQEVQISIQNLVKIYDRPQRFSREWFAGLKIRQRAGLERNFHSLLEFEHLLWQIPLLAFLLYFSFEYLDPGFWAYLMAFLTWLFVREFIRPFILLWQFKYVQTKNEKYQLSISILSKIVYWFLPIIELIFIFRAGGGIGALIGFSLLWYVGLLIAYTSDKLDKQQININRITGRFGALRRATYRIVQSIPIIGKKKKPFRALNGVSLEIKTGMFGLLGPNGAGKSTMMRIICGIFEQSYGKIFINGIDTQEKREELQGLIGYLPQEFGTYESMSSWNYLNYIALLKGLKNRELREERLEYVLKAVHMWDKKDSAIGSFSGGMKQRIGIAQILLHLPRILVVDEPTAGLDPRERIRFRNLLVELSRERIVIFSTHIIEDIASSCNQVGVVIRGQVKYTGTPSDMVHLAQNLVWQYDLSPEEFEQLEDKKMVLHHMYVEDKIRLRYLSKEQPHPTAITVTPILEDAYLCLIKDLKNE